MKSVIVKRLFYLAISLYVVVWVYYAFFHNKTINECVTTTDSISHDSIERRLGMLLLESAKHSRGDSRAIVIICDSDKTYHTYTNCKGLYKDNIPFHSIPRYKTPKYNLDNYKITTEKEALKLNYIPCYWCEDVEDVYENYYED